MPNPNIKDSAKKFSSTYQPKHNGRKKKIYNIASKEYKIGKTEYYDIFNYVMNLNIEELKALGDKKDTPCWIVQLCHAIYKDIQKGTSFTNTDLLDRMIGKAGQSVDVTTNGKSITHEPIIVKIIDKREQLEDNGDTNN
jgi:hypothetical protein